MTIYLSGPMTGIPNYNIEEFNKYAKKYRDLGFTVISPPELGTVGSYAYLLRNDLKHFLSADIDRVYALRGWRSSKGATLEILIARRLEIPVFSVETDEEIDFPPDNLPSREAENLVYGDRAKAYGHPSDDYGRLAGMVNGLLRAKLKEPVTDLDMVLFMMLVKISRLVHSSDHHDSLVDIVGYVLVYNKILERLKECNVQDVNEKKHSSEQSVLDASSREEPNIIMCGSISGFEEDLKNSSKCCSGDCWELDMVEVLRHPQNY